MSDQMISPRQAWRRRLTSRAAGHDVDADRGMTLPELLISILVTGTLVAAMAVVTSVVLRQADNTQGRLNNSRSEQSVGLWMPADLASAEQVYTGAGVSPCRPPEAPGGCPAGITIGGSNALMLSWTGFIAGESAAIPTRTTVSYRYVQVGIDFHVVRVACVSVNNAPPTCDEITLLHDVDHPPVGTTWIPGTTPPSWVMLVSLALDPAAPDEGSGVAASQDPTYHIKNGRRVTVTINGGGDMAGAGGGQDKITLSAGGVDRETNLSTSNINVAPTFAATRSRCGGNFGMLVDTSQSIGDANMASVKAGIVQFVNSFAGTPIKLQVVEFDSTANTLGAGAGWSRYYDMLNDADVNDLKTQVATLKANYSTNYEDALFRMFMNSDGTTQQLLPDTLIFFTDGMPTYNRLNSGGTSATAPAVPHPDDDGFPASTGSSFSQLAWNRANRIARQFDVDVDRFIGVYVGADTIGSSTWSTQGAGYHLETFLRGYHNVFDRGYHLTNWERGYHLEYQYASSGIKWQQKKNGSYTNPTNLSKSQYDASNANQNYLDTDGYRAFVQSISNLGSWKTETKALFDKSNNPTVTPDANDGYQAVKVYSSPYDLWETVAESSYVAGNAGYRATKNYTAPFTAYEASTEAAYNANSSDPSYRSTKTYTSPYSLWEGTTEAAYKANPGGNRSDGPSDGWDSTKVYTLPYTFHENITTSSVKNTEILSRIITVGDPVPAVSVGGVYTNAAVADLYVLPNFTQFAGAINAVALAECGGTVTLQTRVGAAAAPDPFTYQNSQDKTIATTSQQYRSGTFDFDMPNGQPVNVDISPVDLSNLARYAPVTPVSWACKANGADYPFTASVLPGSDWSKISLTVAPNTAISCIQTVKVRT